MRSRIHDLYLEGEALGEIIDALSNEHQAALLAAEDGGG